MTRSRQTVYWLTAATTLAALIIVIFVWMPLPLARITLDVLQSAARTRPHPPKDGSQAIVVLGGRPSRGIKAADAARITNLPVYAAGGELVPIMAPYGVTPKWVESVSVDTRTNASVAACTLKPYGIRNIVLVTDELHMFRAELWFRWYGFVVTPMSAPIPQFELTHMDRRQYARHELGGVAEFFASMVVSSMGDQRGC